MNRIINSIQGHVRLSIIHARLHGFDNYYLCVAHVIGTTAILTVIGAMNVSVWDMSNPSWVLILVIASGTIFITLSIVESLILIFG